MHFKNTLFLFITLFLSYQYEVVRCEVAFGGFDEILDNIRLQLRNVSIPHLDFDTNEQEFGRFKGTLDNVQVTETDQFQIIAFDMSTFPPGVKNLTVRFPSFVVRGKYNLDGTLIFPIGNQPLHVFGNGGMTIKFGESSAFTKIILGYKAGQRVVKDLDVSFDITTMKVKMENLMGGGVLEDIFNEYFSEIGPTLYNYYKLTLMEEVKKPLAEAITKLLREI